MNGMTLLKALNNIDDKYIQEAAPADTEIITDIKKTKKRNIVSFVAGVATLAAAAAVVIIVGIQKNNTIQQDEDMVTLANPYVYYETLEEAEKAVGFDIAVPEVIGNEKISEIIVIAEDTIEIDYGTDQESVVTIRKAKGSEDISGDYNTYGFEKTISVDGLSVAAKGDNNLIMLLTWQKGEYTYSLNVPEGMTEEQALETLRFID